jgi:hypothetical protein
VKGRQTESLGPVKGFRSAAQTMAVTLSTRIRKYGRIRTPMHPGRDASRLAALLVGCIGTAMRRSSRLGVSAYLLTTVLGDRVVHALP